MEGLLFTIERSLNKLTDKNRIIAEFILKKPSDIIWLSIRELAERLSISQASISRFSQYFGFSGFAELKIVISQQLVRYNNDKIYEFDSEDMKKNIIGNLLNQNISSLNDTASMLSRGNLTTAAELIHNARNIMCTGIGASKLVADDMAHKLYRTQKQVLVPADNDLKKIALTSFTKDDLMIAVSYSGKKFQTLELARIARLQGTPVIAVTKMGRTPLSQIATVSLEVAAFEDDFRASAISSRIASLYVVDVLFYTYCLFYCEAPIEKLHVTYNAVNL